MAESKSLDMMSAPQPGAGIGTPAVKVVGEEQIKKLLEILQKYKAGKVNTERRILSSENWWKMRNAAEERGDSATIAKAYYKSASGWLHNVLTNKHADAMEAYPEPNVLPREEQDKPEAAILSSIIPCILEQNEFEQVYSDCAWQKVKTGTGVYKVVWDASKLNGLGDINISRCNLLNLYWEPGVTDIQKSRFFFHTELMDKEVIEEMYPELQGKLKGQSFLSTRFLYDDTVPTDGKLTVVECYYKKHIGGKTALHYVKFVNDQVIFASEDNPEMAERGLYDHGLYPYVFDTLFPVEGSPCGYGYVDVCRNPQTTIDMLNTSFVKNAMAGATPRYFRRADAGVNAEQFLDLTQTLVDVNGNLGEDALREVPAPALPGVYVELLDRTVNELRETSGNTETATGSTSSGVTAASAIAALQEASGKGSRDSTLSSYRAYTKIVNLCIELIRQFYDMPRQFRIVGQRGAERFITYSNDGLQPQAQGMAFGVDMGYRLPVFDIKVSAQKKNVYTKVSQNELALQFFQLGFFNPQMSDQALMCIDMMDFDGKDTICQSIERNGTMFQKLTQYMQLALALAAKAAPDMVQGLSNDIMQTMGAAPAMGGGAAPVSLTQGDAMGGGVEQGEHPFVAKAREQSLNSSQPGGGERA